VRLREIDLILGRLRQHRDQPHLLVGDINATPTSRVLERVLDDGYHDCYATIYGASGGFTRPADVPTRRIDYVLADHFMARRLRDCGVHSGDHAEVASDHRAVWAEFDTAGPGEF
jgi:exodeoxyribonuclease III